MDLKKMFDDWASEASGQYQDQQWLLSKWEVNAGVRWPQEKIDVMAQTIVEGLDLGPDQLLADLGCGGGWIMRLVRSRVKFALGVDFSLPMLVCAKNIFENDKFVCGAIGDLPFRQKTFDRALSYFVFLNFMDDDFVDQALLDVHRVLKDGGRALIGQLPDLTRSKDYDRAKQEYLDYCQEHFDLGESLRDKCRAPQKLFDRERIVAALKRQGITYHFRDSFNPFYRPDAPATVDWRFDLIIEK